MACLIGIDVGGTNTDSVLLDPSRSSVGSCVVSWNKQVTSHNVSKGIQDSIEQLFVSQRDVRKQDILSVTIGTTHFINAIVERDQIRLQKVAVLRLCGPYSQNVPPFTDFPKDLAHLMNGYIGYLQGGYHVDGQEIASIDESEVREHAHKIKGLGLKTVAISGIFSPVFTEQETKVAKILEKELSGVHIVTSNELSGIGLLERENLAILNASVKRFANNIINTFVKAVKSAGIDAPILLTQNDGTVLTIPEALKIPIKTFSSGTTNSMRGASFLQGKFEGRSVIVVDVGGTTTDVGLLLPNGYPRKTSSFSFIGGVKTRLSMPQVESIGLGGGSIVRQIDAKVTVGPDSIGNDFSKSIVGGGSILTTTDVAISEQLEGGSGTTIYAIGDRERIRGKVSRGTLEQYKSVVLHLIEKVIDRMKTSPEDIPVLLVGGGSFILPDNIKGASEVWRPQFFQVANAIGAAIGKVSAVAQSFGKLDDKETIIEQLKKDARDKAIANGAKEDSITVVDISSEELPYVNMHKFEVRIVADVDYGKLKHIEDRELEMSPLDTVVETISKDALGRGEEEEEIDYSEYVPTVAEGVWNLSQTDLELLRIGTYVLGCGGGGDPYPQYLIARNLLAKGLEMKVIDVDSRKGYSSICVAFVGSPTVANERIQGSEIMTAYNMVNFGGEIDTVLGLEIGGGNGFQALLLGAELDRKVVDADLMGRAYPMIWQITPVVCSDEPCFSPCAFSDGNGNDVLVKRTKSNKSAESLLRAALSELGVFVGMVAAVKDVNDRVIKNSISLAWRIGRAVSIARQRSDIANLCKYIIDSIKPTSAKKLFEGKIVGVEKKIHKGYVFGEVVIESSNKRTMRIPFQNENLVAKIDGEVVASIPDLIAVIDSETGEAVGTPDYKYGLLVVVLAISPSNLWTDTARGLEVGGPGAFGLEDVVYKPIGHYTKPLSVIDEFK
jgi:N-methylhydantoinase A/oxoprolinase/acetone carboxylase beta subunit/DUF917 family protein